MKYYIRTHNGKYEVMDSETDITIAVFNDRWILQSYLKMKGYENSLVDKSTFKKSENIIKYFEKPDVIETKKPVVEKRQVFENPAKPKLVEPKVVKVEPKSQVKAKPVLDSELLELAKKLELFTKKIDSEKQNQAVERTLSETSNENTDEVLVSTKTVNKDEVLKTKKKTISKKVKIILAVLLPLIFILAAGGGYFAWKSTQTIVSEGGISDKITINFSKKKAVLNNDSVQKDLVSYDESINNLELLSTVPDFVKVVINENDHKIEFEYIADGTAKLVLVLKMPLKQKNLKLWQIIL